MRTFAGSYTLREPQPYCWLDTSQPDKIKSWIVYVDGFGFTVAGCGVSPTAATEDAVVYADDLANDSEYREFRRKIWFRELPIEALNREHQRRKLRDVSLGVAPVA